MRIDRKKLIVAMMDKNINTIQLAEKAGVSRATVSGIRCGKSCAHDTLKRICKALEVEPDKIIE